MSVIHAPKKPDLDFRVLAFPAVMAVLLFLLFLRLWYIQVVKAPELIERAEATGNTTIRKLAPRGLMYDRNNQLIAGVRPAIVVTAIPSIVLKGDWVIDRLATMLKADPKRLRAKVQDNSFRPHLAAPIFVGADIEVGTRIAEAGDLLPGIGVETQPMRTYSDSRSFTHVLGYVWTPNEKDVKRIEEMGLELPTYVGKSGLEKAYEAELMGKAGVERLEVDARRRPLKVSGRDAALAGSQLILSLDARLQKYATELFAQSGYLGGVAAIDPSTGEVLCLVSSPTFDQNVFSGGISDTEWKALSEHPNKPMWNRATRAAYPPGSTFKIVTTIAALQSGKFDPNATYHCAGGVRVGRFFKCLGHHGSISFHRAMTVSCNSYFYQLGRTVGEDALRKACLDVGLGAPTGLEIGGESPGIVPTKEWYEKWYPGEKWYGGHTLNFSIGQGFLNTTPIQMANVAALVANKGTSYKPHLVRAIKDATGVETLRRIEPEVAHEIPASPEFWGGMQNALVSVIEQGTARRTAKIPGELWGGKTGSAEHAQGSKTHGWFVGFAPAQQPKIAICVLVEAAGHGGDIAAPIAKALVKKYLDLQNADRNAPAASAAVDAPASSPTSR